MAINVNNKGKPACPNHGEVLEDTPWPLPRKGKGICPVSGVEFAFEAEVDEDKMVQDKDGNLQKSSSWRVEGEE